MIHSNFPRCFYPAACCKILHYVTFRGRRCDVTRDPPLEVAGLPGSVCANEIMRNVWVCFTNAPRREPRCNVVVFDCPLSRQGHQSSTGKFRAWLTGCRAGKPEEDGSSLGDELKKLVNGHKEMKTCLCRAEKWVQSLDRECKSAWDAVWCLLTAIHTPRAQETKEDEQRGLGSYRKAVGKGCSGKTGATVAETQLSPDTGTWRRHQMP